MAVSGSQYREAVDNYIEYLQRMQLKHKVSLRELNEWLMCQDIASQYGCDSDDKPVLLRIEKEDEKDVSTDCVT